MGKCSNQICYFANAVLCESSASQPSQQQHKKYTLLSPTAIFQWMPFFRRWVNHIISPGSVEYFTSNYYDFETFGLIITRSWIMCVLCTFSAFFFVVFVSVVFMHPNAPICGRAFSPESHIFQCTHSFCVQMFTTLMAIGRRTGHICTATNRNHTVLFVVMLLFFLFLVGI